MNLIETQSAVHIGPPWATDLRLTCPRCQLMRLVASPTWWPSGSYPIRPASGSDPIQNVSQPVNAVNRECLRHNRRLCSRAAACHAAAPPRAQTGYPRFTGQAGGSPDPRSAGQPRVAMAVAATGDCQGSGLAASEPGRIVSVDRGSG